MPITPEESLRRLIFFRDRARGGAKAVADAMAEHIRDRVANETLTRRRNPPGTFYKARPGEPPAFGTGTLAKSIYSTPAAGGLRASALVGSDDKRALLFEYGCVLRPGRGTHMGWKDSGGIWRHRSVTVTPHPFLAPTVEEAIRDGSLRRVAIAAGKPYDP